MKYAVEMDSAKNIYISSFIKIGSGIRKLMWRGFTDTQTAWRSHKPFLKNKESTLRRMWKEAVVA
jgi:hypothetical protein